MSLPKALLCCLGDVPHQEPVVEEQMLRAAGFATATVYWKDLISEISAWTQLAEILSDDSICAWVFSGRREHVTPDFLKHISFLTLGLNRPDLPATAIVLRDDGESSSDEQLIIDLPPLLSHVKIYKQGDPFSAKLMAARFKPRDKSILPFFLRADLSPLLGIWLEIHPTEAETWPGFMLSVTGAEIAALGVGPAGVLPKTCTLNYPIFDIEGIYQGQPFNGRAARNTLSSQNSAYIKLNQCAGHLLISGYPDDDSENDSMAQIISFL